MRIRNSRPPCPFPVPPDPPSRSNRRLSQGNLRSEDPFLFDETSWRIGWSCYPLKNPSCQTVEEGSSGKLQLVVTVEISSINCEDTDNRKYHSIKENSSQVFGGKHGGQGNDGNESYASNTNHERGAALKKRKQCHYLEKEIEKDGQEDEILEEKVEMQKVCKEDAEEEMGNRRSGTIYCVMKCEYFIPSPKERLEGYGIRSEMALETVSQLKGILRRGSKGEHQSGDAD